LKIAHIGNTAGVASIIAEEQKKNNHTVEVFVFDKLLHEQFGGTFIDYRFIRRINKGNKSVNFRWFLERKRLFKRLQNYEIWHYHYPYGSLKRNISKHLKGQKLLNHYHGDDLRNKLDNNFCIVSTPDLLKFAPHGVWVPNPVNVPYIRNFVCDESSKPSIFRVAHYPYYRSYPGYPDYYSYPLSNLEKKGKCKVVTVFRQDYPATLRTLANCDVVIGKILPSIGWFGKFELEAMALGKPVIAYISDELFEKFRPPVYRTKENTFEKDLETLLESVTEQRRLGDEGRSYVEKNHSVKHVCNLIEKYYQNW
jgi:glycosyltransferase involved in cell wall biosynthesis